MRRQTPIFWHFVHWVTILRLNMRRKRPTEKIGTPMRTPTKVSVNNIPTTISAHASSLERAIQTTGAPQREHVRVAAAFGPVSGGVTAESGIDLGARSRWQYRQTKASSWMSSAQYGHFFTSRAPQLARFCSTPFRHAACF
jgi:hypothetical protein